MVIRLIAFDKLTGVKLKRQALTIESEGKENRKILYIAIQNTVQLIKFFKERKKAFIGHSLDIYYIGQ